ncbi:MAG: ATP-binding protein, partial [Cyanobacteria bacterium P01_A01_bin.83]
KFKEISEEFKKILPVFGVHPLSNIFHESPIFLVEGEDDLRIWQQAIRTSNGRLKIYPCSVDSINHLDKYEKEVCQIINSIYESAKAYSLRDRDNAEEEINDLPPVTRTRLSCRAAENLLLSDDVLSKLKISWDELKSKIESWLEKNPSHSHYSEMNNFKTSGYDRKNFKLKEIRNDLMGILESNKPWEIIVGQSIGNLTINDSPSENSLQAYLGNKLIENVFNS